MTEAAPLACVPRSRANLLHVVKTIDPENNPELKRRDVTGDGKPETFCNLFVRLYLAALEVVIPALLANALFDWFPSEAGQKAGWRCVNSKEAVTRAELGFPTIGVWKNTGGHGHIVAVVPAVDAQGGALWGALHSAQAGASNWSNLPIERAGLRADAYSFFTRE